MDKGSGIKVLAMAVDGSESKIECTHGMTKRKRGPRAGVQRVTKRSDSVRSLVNRILSTSKPFDVPEDPEVVRKMLVDLANFARSLDRQLAETRDAGINEVSDNIRSSAASKFTYQQEPPEIKDSIESLTEDFQKMLVDVHWQTHYGKSSNNMLIQITLDAKRDELDEKAFAAAWTEYQRPELWKILPWQRTIEAPEYLYLEFPERDSLNELITTHFEELNPFFPLLHRPTFEASVAEHLHLRDRSFGLVVLAVCAVASPRTDNPRNMPEDTSNEHSVGWRWFRQIPVVRPSLSEATKLYDLQLCVLFVFYLQMISGALAEAVWTIIGLGIRCAQQRGLHRRKPKGQKPTVAHELWKRAFNWILVSTDLVASVIQGRPRATTPDDFDAELPAECDDEFWEPTDPELAFIQPEGKPSTTAFFLSLLKAGKILGFAERTVYGVRQSDFWKRMGISKLGWKQKAMFELGEISIGIYLHWFMLNTDAALNKFLDTIPDHLCDAIRISPLGANPDTPYQMVARVIDVLNAVINVGQPPMHSIPPTNTQNREDLQALTQQECLNPMDLQASKGRRKPDSHASLATEFVANIPAHTDNSIHTQQVPPTLEQSTNFPCTDSGAPYYPQQVGDPSAALPFEADIQTPQPFINGYATGNSYASAHVPSYSLVPRIQSDAGIGVGSWR
ncbi:hypothetical protein WG66_013584 [Moniliophthora roreri]|nr:hypothetical protein WG66_013584 [Moniliophthora roreri]